MTKVIAAAFTAAALFIGTNVNAQTTPKSAWRFGIGLEGAVPTGLVKTNSDAMIGGTARLQYGISDNLALTVTSGYYHFLSKEVNGFDTGAPHIVPLKAGIKAFFTDNLYFGAEAGAGFTTNAPDASGDHNTKLLLAPGIGYANKSWDIGARYENFSGQGFNFGMVGLRVAYGFAL